MSNQIEHVFQLLQACTTEQRRVVFTHLRKEFHIHPLEKRLNTEAEIILEAIARDETGLTFRMMRGVIAEAAFEIEVVKSLKGWNNTTPDGDLAYDFRLEDHQGPVRIQVKLQRSKAGEPMKANQGYRYLSSVMYVVETQRTRGGKDSVTGEDTRPYRFGEFDILAVAMHPSTNEWNRFMYTVTNWLLPRPGEETKLLKFQPVAILPNNDWTDDFEECVTWLRSETQKRIKAK